MSELLIDKPRPGITVITLNRPKALNALTYGLLAELLDAFDAVDADPESRVVILTGAGRGFCSGLDLSEFSKEPPPPNHGGFVQRLMLSQKGWWMRLMPRMRALRSPIIAAVNGPAAGAGLVLAVASDIRIASDKARFHDAFTKIGLSGCELGLSWLLPRLIGAAASTDLILTGRQIDAQEAYRLGLVVDVVDEEALMAAALAKADQIVANTPFGVWMSKDVAWANLEISSMQAAIELETRTQTLGQCTEDMKEQLAAFLQKRPPVFKNA